MRLKGARLHAVGILSLALVALSCGTTNAAAAQERRQTGTVCVAPVPPPTGEDRSLHNPAGDNRAPAFSIRIGDRPPTAVSDKSTATISGLAPGRKHLVKIYRDGELKESFRFTFGSYSSTRLCLWFNGLYGTWSLWEAKEAGAKCRCK